MYPAISACSLVIPALYDCLAVRPAVLKLVALLPSEVYIFCNDTILIFGQLPKHWLCKSGVPSILTVFKLIQFLK